MNTPILKTALIVSVIAFAIALKVVRYNDTSDAAATAANAHISNVMSDHGWTESDHEKGSQSSLYKWRLFSRNGCPKPVVVAIMGGNAEGAEFFRQQHAGDVAFIQDRDVEQHPSGFSRQLSGFMRDVGRVFGGTGNPRLPVLAIAPRPRPENTCSGPPASAWRT